MIWIHAAATLYMTGLIWFVQVVHYPLMARVGRGEFAAYEGAHTSRTAWVVGPAMLAEAGTAVALVVDPAADAPRAQAWLGLALVVVLWASSAFLQVPLHRRLATGFDAVAHRSLVRTNWLRTVVWTARALLVGSWIAT